MTHHRRLPAAHTHPANPLDVASGCSNVLFISEMAVETFLFFPILF
jgi:hypothetical protein